MFVSTRTDVSVRIFIVSVQFPNIGLLDDKHVHLNIKQDSLPKYPRLNKQKHVNFSLPVS